MKRYFSGYVFRAKAVWVAALMVIVCCSAAWAAPKAELWELWLKNDPASRVKTDHSEWDRFLSAYVVASIDGINKVRYSSVKDEDRKALKSYIAGLQAVSVSGLNRDEQRAFWINLYNALTVDLILDYYPVNSIRDIDISPGFFSDGPWGRKLARVEGTDVSLDDIEHRILRPIWKDPRIHYAVNCAAMGCPNLQKTAFTSENIEGLLDAGAREFINHPRGARVKDGRLYASSIYKWFKEDFGGNDQGVIAHLRLYADADLMAGLNGIKRVSGYDYDWSLNGIR